MATPTNILPSNAPLITANRLMSAEWYRYFVGQNRNTTAAIAGEVLTPVGSGLEGGGAVATGISLTIAPNGVTNGMIRQSAGNSVVGRAPDSAGNVADITADANERVLSREDDIVAFRSFINGVALGPDTPITSFRLASDPPATAASAGAQGTITWDSGFLYVCTATDTWKRVAIATW